MIVQPFSYLQQAVPAAAAAGPSIVTSGLVLYMDATDVASYPGSGASIFNLVAGKPITGSLVNTPTYKNNYIQYFLFK